MLVYLDKLLAFKVYLVKLCFSLELIVIFVIIL